MITEVSTQEQDCNATSNPQTLEQADTDNVQEENGERIPVNIEIVAALSVLGKADQQMIKVLRSNIAPVICNLQYVPQYLFFF